MITTMLQGGLGNQMFQYAMGLAQAQRLRTELRLDASMLNGGNPHRILNLDLFEGVLKHEVVYGSKANITESGFAFNEGLNKNIIDGDILRGYWQCEDYFRDYAPQVYKAFRSWQPMPQLFFPYAKERIIEAGKASCFLGIRRGDYLAKQEFHGVLPMDYYHRALNYIHNMTGIAPQVFVFSDDMAWCKDEIRLRYPYEVVGSFFPTIGNVKGREDADLYLMDMCQNAVIANSSYHWWGAWLGDMTHQPRIVVAPKQWFTDPSMDSSTVTPGRWARL
jgi:hypothetical protein